MNSNLFRWLMPALVTLFTYLSGCAVTDHIPRPFGIGVNTAAVDPWADAPWMRVPGTKQDQRAVLGGVQVEVEATQSGAVVVTTTRRCPSGGREIRTWRAGDLIGTVLPCGGGSTRQVLIDPDLDRDGQIRRKLPEELRLLYAKEEMRAREERRRAAGLK